MSYVSRAKPDLSQLNRRVASIDWMRGIAMVLMVIDHAAMAFDANHLDHDSALYADARSMPLPAAEFLTRWMTHLCAPTFVFLAGTALALSIERRVLRGNSHFRPRAAGRASRKLTFKTREADIR